MNKYNERLYYTIKELHNEIATNEDIPSMYKTNTHLVYSSPATLFYNSPGAEGYGVKRAALAIPNSVMLIVAPACCSRNTSLVSTMSEYNNRFFYLNMDETDLITSRHFKKIPKAIKEIYDFLEVKPSLFMICSTCVDALLATDMESIARKSEEEVGVLVRPCYMYALSREGANPPMVQVRQSLYSILEKQKKKSTSVNILGYFSSLIPDTELYTILKNIGIKKIRQISNCKDIDEFMCMSEANFNIVLHEEARAAAIDMHKDLDIPFIEMNRLYDIDKIEKQYMALSQILGEKLDVSLGKDMAMNAILELQQSYPDISISIGESVNANPFELALALSKYGFKVQEIFANPSILYLPYIKELEKINPNIRVYSNMEPGMLYYDDFHINVDLTIGKDASYYHNESVHIMWNEDIQPFGYKGLENLLTKAKQLLDERKVNERS